jgi:hypothetical protein
MSIFSRHNRRHLVPLHCDNARSKDWIILLEANTIVGPSQESFRVARATQERRIVRRLWSLRRQLFLFVEGYDEFDTLVVEAPRLVPPLPAPLEAGSREREAEKTLGS